MEMAVGTRPISTAWLFGSHVRRGFTVFPVPLKNSILATAGVLFLFSSTIAWSVPFQGQGQGQIYGQSPMQPRSGWNNGLNNSGGQHFGGQQGNGNFQQQRHPEHLPQWYRQHQNLSPQQQQRALHNEPGFNRLPSQEQQRLSNRLQQLNSMPPERRQRILQRNEALEKLSPEQRQQVRSTMQQASQMPEDRRRMMRRAFRDIAQLPPAQRQAILDSPQFKTQFSDQERQILGTMMSIEPYNLEQHNPEQRSPEPLNQEPRNLEQPPGSGMEYYGR